jgi:2-polyprenyl-3-methyl-5-hydroxy-6-metoxy-1,4-benzoquinol methylase
MLCTEREEGGGVPNGGVCSLISRERVVELQSICTPAGSLAEVDSSGMTERFDKAYYARHYESKQTQVHSSAQIHSLSRGIVGMIGWWGGELRSVLDVGAGTGIMRDWFSRHMPKVRYRSTEFSAFACAQYGHEQRDISVWRAKTRFDLVVCQGVLPYLDDTSCAKAIENLAAMSRGFLYLEAITGGDIKRVCDTELTDTAVHRRKASWYRMRLAKHYVQVGGGLYYARTGPLSFYELEAGSQ